MKSENGVYKYSINKYDLAGTVIYQANNNIKLRRAFKLTIMSICFPTALFIGHILKLFILQTNIFWSILLDISLIVAVYFIITSNLQKFTAMIFARDIKKNTSAYEVSVIIEQDNIKYSFGENAYEFSIKDILKFEEREEATYIQTSKVIICVPKRVLLSQEDKEKFMKL